MRWVAAVAFVFIALLARPLAAQVDVVEEEELDEDAVVERGYIRGEGRGVQFGAHLISPIYLSDLSRGAALPDRLVMGGGGGVHARLGWEFPYGFTLEVFGGLAGNGVDTQGVADVNTVLTRVEVGLGFRYMFFNDTAFVPFFGIGAMARWLTFDWSTDPREATRTVDGEPTVALIGAVGAQIELSPYFGIELGLAVDTMFGLDVFEEVAVSLMPFLGVTLYIYDEDDPVF